MTTNSREIRQLNRVVAKVLSGMKPPENLTVTQWAECKRYLSTEASAEPGLWRTSRTPYLQAIMDAFSDPKVRHIVFVAASQVGKTEVINNMIGYIIDQNPGSTAPPSRRCLETRRSRRGWRTRRWSRSRKAWTSMCTPC